jgi:hypothetical protein
MKSSFDKERNNFELYLLETFDYSKKAAKDCASRCKRIESNLSIDLSKAVSNTEEFENLSNEIQLYAVSISKGKESAYSITGTLRSAAKKYALYLYPEKAKKYPTAHGKSKYATDS